MMRNAVVLFGCSAACVVAAWWWLGLPVEMPQAPFDPGGKLYCVSYAPFRGEQSPLDAGTHIDAGQIDEDLGRLAHLTNCVRTYSIANGLDQIPEIARRHGLKVLQGLWLSSDPVKNRAQIDGVVALAQRYPDVMRAIVVGNEVLLRGELSPVDLGNTIRSVKAAVAVPVTYADVWEFWLKNRDLASAVDFITIHILPYWEDFPIPAASAAAHVDSIRRRVADAFPGKDILIGEVGWPSAGRMREGALPSPSSQARVLHEVLAAAQRGEYRVNLIEAFDQPWKRWLEGTVGGHWGLFASGASEPKFTWGMPVSDHPLWRWQAAGGVVLAFLVFALAAATGRARGAPEPSFAVWAGVAASAAVGGILVGWAVESTWLESLALGGWIRSLALTAVAIAAPLVGAAACASGTPVPTFAEILSRRTERPSDPLVLALGAVLIATTVLALHGALGLVFDPRYRDFPFAPLTAALVPFLVLASARNQAGWTPVSRPDCAPTYDLRARTADKSTRSATSLIACAKPASTFADRALAHPPAKGRREPAETIAAAALALSAVFIALNESLANWQADWLALALLGLAVTLQRSRGVRS